MEKVVNAKQVILRLGDDLIASNVKRFNLSLMDLLEDDFEQDELVVDLEGTENIDSVGVTFIVNLYKTARSNSKVFKVIHSSDDIKQLFKLMKLDEFFELED